ncbi:MAG: glycerol-3-phosphate responsive antiterminator [Chloroflexi bacterium]|nr:MAG: glycerol-3-phosphate responsive antiterminator [Chloroflexota bacterium]
MRGPARLRTAAALSALSEDGRGLLRQEMIVSQAWLSGLRRRPVIAAIRDEDGLRMALDSPATVLLLLSGTLMNIAQLVHRVEREGRFVFVHIDLIDGLAKDQHGLRWLSENARPTGIISTRGSVISAARTQNLSTIQRVFLLDSQSVLTGVELAHNVRPDVVEVLPGILPGVIADLVRRNEWPLIAGGLITSAEHCRDALRAGAWGVSTSDPRLWHLDVGLTEPSASRKSLIGTG